MCFDGTGTGNEGTDSTSTDAYDSGTILSHFHWGYLQSKKNHWLNNIGLRDASASKNGLLFLVKYPSYFSFELNFKIVRDAEAAVAAFIDGVRDLEPTDFSKVFDWISTPGKEDKIVECLFAIM